MSLLSEKPRPPTSFRFLKVNATTLELTWIEGWKGNSPITRYDIQGNNETGFADDRSSKWFDALIVNDPYKIYNLPPVIIRNLKPATVYRFRVRAVNKAGSSSFSAKSGDIRTLNARKLTKEFFYTFTGCVSVTPKKDVLSFPAS